MRTLLIVVLLIAAALSGAAWFGLEPAVRHSTADSVDPETGRLALAGLRAPVEVRRDALGVPLIEAQSDRDLAFATGYVMAQDRLQQMVGMARAAEGRLAEMAGEPALPLDRYMRAVGVPAVAAAQEEKLDSTVSAALDAFVAGVNAYIGTHRDRLPFPLRFSGAEDLRWTRTDSMSIYVMLNLGLSLNLQQETGFLDLAAKVGPERAAWLVPTMPDEPLPFAEAAKLKDVPFAKLAPQVAGLGAVGDRVAGLFGTESVAASNNWVISPSRTKKHASILANDTHLLLQHPPAWMLLQLRSPTYHATGIAIAGVPGIVAGYNGHVAWGMTMVMADGQDLFVERLRRDKDGRVTYQGPNRWFPVTTREEQISVRGRAAPEKFTVRSTSHGPLIDDALRGPAINGIQPVVPAIRTGDEYALALAWTAREPDESMNALFSLSRAKTFAEAQAAVRDIQFIHLNLVYADHDNIGWQVTGRYPRRRAGTGKLPSPGWYNQYDWDGWWGVSQLPSAVNPVNGFIGTANDRKVSPDNPLHLSSSWYYPERGERIDQLLAARDDHDADSSIAMQADQVDLFALKLKRVLLAEPLSSALKASIAALPQADRLRAMEAYTSLTGFDGNMLPGSRDAAVFGMFEEQFPRALFLDELGPAVDSPAYQALMHMSDITYSAAHAHLLQREDSPFWDDVTTKDRKETRADIIARALAATITEGERLMGADHAAWQWGQIHTYTWRSPTTGMRPYLGLFERLFAGRLAPYLDRGPFPAGGDHNTLNVTGWPIGRSYDATVVPAMRLVVDFGDPEPVHLVIAGSQSDDPASPHYADGIPLYLSGRNREMPFNDDVKRHAWYDRVFVLEPKTEAAPP